MLLVPPTATMLLGRPNTENIVSFQLSWQPTYQDGAALCSPRDTTACHCRPDPRLFCGIDQLVIHEKLVRFWSNIVDG